MLTTSASAFDVYDFHVNQIITNYVALWKEFFHHIYTVADHQSFMPVFNKDQ